jgi:predicted NBD/HSP70 family sugar kinase
MRSVTGPRRSIDALWTQALTGAPRQVAEVLRAYGPRTRGELIALTGLSRPTVSASLAEMIATGLVTEQVAASARAGGGRPASLVRLSRRAGVAVGVDVGRRHIRVAAADLGHDILTESEVRLDEDADETAGPVLDLAAKLVDAALAEIDAARDEVVGVGLGIPAPMTRDGRVGAPLLLPGWAGLAPAEELRVRLGVPVVVNNDANLGALGEYHWGAGRGCLVLVYVKLATGIGAGIVLDGQLFVGTAGTAGEIGHVTIDARGPVCRCGNRGCIELAAGGRALVEHARLTYPDIADVSDLVRLANAGDAGCRRLLSDAGAEIGIALSGLVNLINPDRIVLGGELGSGTDVMLEPLRRGLTEAAMPAALTTVTVTRGELGERASALGAVVSVLRSPTSVSILQ